MIKCAKCDSYETATGTLAGGRPAHLCDSHIAEWTEYVRASQAFRRLVECDARENYLNGKCTAGEHVSQAVWLSHAREELLAKSAMFAVSTEWLHDKEKVNP